MISLEYLRNWLETKLNNTLSADELEAAPFTLYTDIGDIEPTKRDLNTVIAPRYGIVNIVSSNVAPIGSLQIYELIANCEILVNVDRMKRKGNVAEYGPVRKVRETIDNLAVNKSAQAELVETDGRNYSVIPVFSLGSIGRFAQVTYALGKVVPISFTVQLSVIENGINSSDMEVYLGDKEEPYKYPLFVTKVSETMAVSTEGQTHLAETQGENNSADGNRSVFTVQETRYGIDFVTPLTNSEICRIFLDVMHNGADNTPYKLTIKYKGIGSEKDENGVQCAIYTHDVIIPSVSLSSEIPNNIGLNVSLVEADMNIQSTIEEGDATNGG